MNTALKPFDLFISGKFPLWKTIYAENLQSAYAKAKKECIQETAEWSMAPIWEGERSVENTFRFEGKKYRVVITNKEFTEQK